MKNVLIFGALMFLSMMMWTYLSDLGLSTLEIFITHIIVGATLGYVTGKAGYEG